MITSGEWCWGTSFYHIGSHYGFLFFRCPTSFYNRPKTFFHSFFTRSIIFHSSLSLVFPVYQTLSSDSIGRKQERVLREQNKFRSLKPLVHTFFMACARQRQHNFHSKWIRCGSGFFHDTVPSCAGCYTGQSRGRLICYPHKRQ